MGAGLAEDVHRIRRFVDALVRRERALLALRVMARAALLILTVLACMVLASAVRLDRGAATMLVVTLAGIGGWVAVALPILLEWRTAGDTLRQARRVEALRPELRGRLVTAIGHTADASGGASDALLALVVRRASAAIQGLGVADVHDARPAVKWAVAASLLWAFGVPTLLLTSGPGAFLAFWFAGASALAEVAGVEVTAPEDLARVGDIVIRYRYPDYTGLEPKVVPNSTGDVQAPPGTVVEVTARSADVVEAAGLVAYDDALEAQMDDEGRVVTARFSIRPGEGAYHLQLYRGGAAERSRDFRIVAQEDLAPEVMLDTGPSEVLEVSVDEELRLRWQARDDFGIRKVGLALDGRDLDRVLARPERRQAEVGDGLYVSPRQLGLKSGDRARLSVVAWDNDTVSGSKRGVSREVELVVLGARGLQEKAAQRREELMAKMIPILARFLTEPWPPGETSGAIAEYGEVVAGRYQPLVDAVEQLWAGMVTDTHDRAVAQRVMDTGRDLVRYTQVSFLPGDIEVPRDDSFAMAAELRDEAIVALEDAILAFHRMRRNDALREIAEQAKDLQQMAARMAETLAQDDPDAQALLARLDALERMMDQLAQKAAKLDESEGLREFLNTRENEARNLMDEIRQAIAEGRLDEARELMERLSELVGEMGEGIEQELERRAQEGEDAADQAKELQQDLEAIEKDQRELQAEVQALREGDKETARKMAALWDELAKKAAAHRRSAEGYATALEASGRAFYEQERAAAGVEEAAELEAAIAARDVRGARQAAGAGRGAWGMARRAYETEAERRRGLPGPGRRELQELQQQLEDIERLLDQLERASESMSPQAQEQAQQLENRQRDLENRLQQAQEKARELEQQFPVKPQGMQEALEDAEQRMQQAAEDLQGGQPMEAEGSQGVAAQRVRDAIDALEQARQQAQQQAQQLQQRDGEQQQGEEQSDDQGHDTQQNRAAIEIPGREEFRTPEEYRRALLEGMEGEVPEEYRAMKRRYYEELVHQ